MGTPLGPKYIPYTYMDPLGQQFRVLGFTVSGQGFGCFMIFRKKEPHGITQQDLYPTLHKLTIKEPAFYMVFSQ